MMLTPDELEAIRKGDNATKDIPELLDHVKLLQRALLLACYAIAAKRDGLTVWWMCHYTGQAAFDLAREEAADD